MNRKDLIINWLKERSLRESIMILLVGCALIYLLWYWLLGRSLELQRNQIKLTITGIEAQTLALQKQANLIENMANKYLYAQKLQERAVLSGQEKNLSEQLENVQNVVVSQPELFKLTNQILLRQSGIVFVNFKKLETTPWVTKELANQAVSANYSDLYKQSFEIEFRGSYFNVIRYLMWLEKLPWRLYCDSLEYKVIQYPDADVVLKFYILVDRKS